MVIVSWLFSTNLGSCSITRAELRGAVSDLGIGYWKVILQIDSKAVLQC
ncbi:hypothetical protein LINPERHAP1_LOCUS11732 [Linum perenne]